jgi:WD40 repeat protein
MTVEKAEARTLELPLEDPYVGLSHFTEEYADFFFGRETESSLVIGNLRAARLTLLYAESGVGKSSVLRAGVVARMREVAARDAESRGSPRLVPVIFSSWSERPLAALIHAIGEAVRPYLAEADLPALPEDDLEAALEAAGEALDATVLVILDQFEEYFLYPDLAPEQDRIAAQVARCVNRPDLRANFLISIREDAYAELGDLFRGRVKNVFGNFLHLDFLDREGGREAIEGPIARLNEQHGEAEPYAIEPALVEAVLEQVGRDEADGRIETTYLQLVMRRLWEQEARTGSHLLRLRTLEELGGAQAIIGGHLDRAMEEAGEGGAGLSREQRRIAAAAFRFLVTSGGAKIALTAADLAELSGFPQAEIEPVLRHLSAPRLHILRPVVFEEEGSEPRYEIFHDALAEPIRKWRNRIEEEERETRLKRQRLEKEEAEKAAAAARHDAEREQQRRRIAQVLLAVTVLAMLIGAAVFAIANKNLADQRQADGESVRVAERVSELSQVPSFGPTAAALASVEAYRLAPTDEAREQALTQLQLNPGLPTVMAGHTDAVETVAYLPGTGMLVSGGDKTVRIWQPSGRRQALLLATGMVQEVAISEPQADGRRVIAAGLHSGKVNLWPDPTGGDGEVDRQSLRTGTRDVRGVAFSPAVPDLLATGGRNGRVVLWRLNETGRSRQLAARQLPGQIEDLAFGDDGESLFVASSEGAYRLAVSAKRFGSERKLADEASAVATAPNGSYAFGRRGGVQVWGAGKRRRAWLPLPGRVYGLAFAEGGKVLVAGGSDWNVTTWNLASGRPFGPPRAANRARINDIAVSPDGADIAAGGADRYVKAWPLHPPWTLATIVGGLSPGEFDKGVPKFYDLVGGDDGRIVTPIGPRRTPIWSLRSLADADASTGPVGRVPHGGRGPAERGTSLEAAQHGNVLVLGSGHSFAVYGTGRVCEGQEEDPCYLAEPAEPYSSDAVRSLVFAPYEEELLLASASGAMGALNLWKLNGVAHGGGVVHVGHLALHTRIRDLSFDPRYRLLAAATGDQGLEVLDVGDPSRPEALEFDQDRLLSGLQPIFAVAFSPDGSLLASGGADQQVRLWRVAEDDAGEAAVEAINGTLLQRQTITALAFSPDGETLAAADAGGNICLYAVDDRHLIGDRSCLRGYNISVLRQNGGIEAMRFVRLPDGETVLLTAGKGQPIVAWSSLLWNLSENDRVEEAVTKNVCRLAGLSLSRGDWEAAFGSTEFAGRYHRTCP